MNNVKTIAASVIIGATALFAGVPEAQAATCFDAPGGGVLCNSYRGTNSNGHSIYRLGYSNGTLEEGMDVVCNGPYTVNWRSHGNFEQSTAEALADYFCSI